MYCSPELRDLNDQPALGTLLAALKTSSADYLISGDKDLLTLADRYPIVTPAQFWATHAGL
jgi:predicted nucleic acid-binding protein